MSDKQGIEIDYCPDCRGIWLDRGELEKIIERSASPEYDTGDPDPYRRENGRAYNEGSHPDSHGHRYGKRRNLLSDLFD
jgi:Zn-finger nucleic acid-binding protein